MAMRIGAEQPKKLVMLLLILWAVLLLSYQAGSVVCAVHHGNDDEEDMLSLLEFKRAITDDPRRALSSWNTSVHFCSWKGVECSSRTGTGRRRVAGLDLAGQSLAGEVCPSLGNMSSLASLDLSRNRLSGRIPPPLGRLHELKLLNLSYNSLQGSVPVTLTNCSSLGTLDLSRNSFSGVIPAEIAVLSNLTRLRLGYNDLTGAIPPELGNLTSLEQIVLMYNRLEGSIPNELGRLSKLAYLLLGENKLSGSVPVALFNLSLLNGMALELNMLVGTLPSEMGDTLPKLGYLTLGGNMLEGHIPASLGNASGLETIGLSYNRFSRQIPASLGRLGKLKRLFLDGNNLEANDNRSWGFLDALSNCTLLRVLSLYGNLLQGVLPNSIGNLSSSVDNLVFGRNMLSGLVPSSIGNLHKLGKVGLDDNNFTGPIDGWVGNLVNLQGLYLEGNKFTGQIPASIGNIPKLSKLFLFSNQFHGPIPSSLENLTQLSILDISYNNLQGNIPKEVFTIATLVECQLNNNNLEGPIPDISNLQQLSYLDLSSNKLTGEVPPTLGRCQQLERIRADQNILTGSIPTFLGSLSSFTMINLSHNNFSGTIPISLSNLQLLTQLDLSDNQLEGEIPRNGVFGNVTAISLKGNWRLCGGVLELHMPSCPSDFQRSRWRHYLVRVLIPILAIVLLTLMVYFTIFRKKKLTMQVSLPFSNEQFPKVSYKDIAQATENFTESNLIGRGRHGSVYRGRLAQVNMIVAVKVFHLEIKGADRSYMSECKTLRSIRHRNLVPILTACSTIDDRGNDFKALVYEFMANGNLDTWLHQQTTVKNVPNQLGLAQRINIAVDIADALKYLHHDCQSPIIHCDLKPSNILLDDDITARLGDFGISRFYLKPKLPSTDGDSSSIGTIGLKGTIGYIAPEYAGGSHISTFGDVYSFGVVLLEILLGKRPTDPMFCDGLGIVSFVERSFPYEIVDILDAYLQEEFYEIARADLEEEQALHQYLLSLLQVALACTRKAPGERANMRETAAKLRAIKTSYISWTER